MNKKTLLMLALLSSGIGLEAKVIVVDDDGMGDYRTIGEAVAVADSGDTVFVKKGRYVVFEITLNVPLSLLGEDTDSTIIEGIRDYPMIVVGSEGCIISRFTFYTKGCNVTGVGCWGTSPLITYNNFIWEGVNAYLAHGIKCWYDASPFINYNNFYISTDLGYVIELCMDSLNIDARYNYWNTTDKLEIQEMIYDNMDYGDLGTVYYSPWLEEPVGISEESSQSSPISFLGQNFTNPFSSPTLIVYQLAGKRPMRISLKIYNTTGKLIKVLIDEVQMSGIHTVNWDGRDYQGNKVPSGIYFYRLETEGYAEVKKAVISR